MVGTAIGAYVGSAGGAQGMMSGAQTGNSFGTMIGGLADKKKNDVGPGVGGGRAAMSRRAEALQPMNPDQYAPQLAAAETAAQQLPPAQQAQYLPAIQKARQLNSGVA